MERKESNFRPITHRAVFALVMEDPKICSEFLKFVLADYDLGMDFDSITENDIVVEKTFVSVNMKELRIDVFVTGEDWYSNLEMQNRRVKGYDLPKRSKYHHMEMTQAQLSRGIPFSALKPTIVIFVCMYDECGCNLPRYTAKMNVLEDKRASFEDGTITVILNMSYTGEGLPVNVKQVYDYFRTGVLDESNDMLGRIDGKVAEVNDTGRKFIMTFEQELMIERQEGIEIGKEIGEEIGKEIGEKIGKANDAREMLIDHVPVEKVMQYTKLSREEVEEIAEELLENAE